MTIKSPWLIALSVALAAASLDVMAGQPNSHCIGYFDTIAVVDCPGGFSVMDDAMVFGDVKGYCNQEGVSTRSHIKLTAKDSFYRADDPKGVSVKGTVTLNERATFDEWGNPMWTPLPIVVGIHAHGLGYMFLDVGMLTIDPEGCWDVDFNPLGRFSGWTGADYDALCAYFE